MMRERKFFSPYFNTTEKQFVYSALEEAADYLQTFYCFSAREWFNHCYDIKTEGELNLQSVNNNAFAEVKQYTSPLNHFSPFPPERYQICLFDHNILAALWSRTDLEFYPFMVYVLTHELIHVARFCQNFHPFECNEKAVEREEEKVNKLTQQVLSIRKNDTFYRLNSLYSKEARPIPLATSLTRV